VFSQSNYKFTKSDTSHYIFTGVSKYFKANILKLTRIFLIANQMKQLRYCENLFNFSLMKITNYYKFSTNTLTAESIKLQV